MAKNNALKRYREKRDFTITSEPAGGGKANESQRAYVIQKHWATRLHYDLRLELNGSMKSWAVPKGPSLDPRDKRLAVHVEDHPIAYNTFEGEIPAHQYGAGKVIIWDKGIWVPLGDPAKDYRAGHLKFILQGHKLQGQWALIRMEGKKDKQEPWLLIKEKDEAARVNYSIVDALPDSVSNLKSIPRAATKKAPPTAARHAAIDGGAQKSSLPTSLAPQLATLVNKPPPPENAEEWIYEIKFDGYRLLTRIEGKKVHLYTRHGHDWSHKLPALVEEIKKFRWAPGWFDGEIVVLNEHGISNFQALQGAFDQSHTAEVVYYLFDLPYYDGWDLRAIPLVERQQQLRALIEQSSSTMVRFSDTFQAVSADLLASACHLGLEGLIAKRKLSPYVSGRSRAWIKLKCHQRQEFVIGGYTDPQGARAGIGALLLGVYDDQNKLNFCGKVGTGFDHATLLDIHAKLRALATQKPPFSKTVGLPRTAHWVQPTLLAEVSFSEWTQDGHLRHPVFEGLRVDKKTSTVKREKPVNVSQVVAPALPPRLKISHPERVIDSSTKLTKRDLIQFYVQVAPLIMEHLKGRPVSLVRAPEGIGGELFFQKHWESAPLPGIKLLDPSLDPGHAPLLEVASAQGLWSAAQMNVIEFHTWNAVKSNIDKPNRMTFDLDPGEGVTWPMVQEAAQVVREFLIQLKLISFIKTSGGKGLHIVVPVKRLYDWDQLKNFSQAIVQHLAHTLPQRFSAKSGPRNRVGKIFIDYLRNGFGSTTVAAWSARARPGLGISVPIAWNELETISASDQWKVTNIEARLAVGNTPWKDYPKTAQGLKEAMHILGYAGESELPSHE